MLRRGRGRGLATAIVVLPQSWRFLLVPSFARKSLPLQPSFFSSSAAPLLAIVAYFTQLVNIPNQVSFDPNVDTSFHG